MIRLLVASALLLSGVAACGRAPEPRSAIDSEAFVAAWVDLRVEALTSDTGTLDEEGRRVVLERHGVTEDDLLEFAEVHGSDPVFMQELWNDVEARLDEIRGEAYAPSTDGARSGDPVPPDGERPPGARLPLPDSAR